jgi:putative ABC transport system ATP-binding protein
MTTSQPLIDLHDIRKVFLTDEIETRALDGIDFSVHKGEFVSISGPSGCGKSTLLSILGLLEAPSAGRYSLNGRDVSNLSLVDRAKVRNLEIGFIFQSFNLIGDLSVLENVELPLAYRGLPPTDRRRMAEAALDKMQMSHRRKHLPSQLSGGQQQRVAVARALAGNPSILLADEPTGNLDSKNGAAVMEMLAQLNAEGSTICMVTHDDRYAHVAKRIIRLLDGRIVDHLPDSVPAPAPANP